MESNMESHEGERTGVATNIIDAIVAILVIIMGGTIIYGSRKLGSEWTSDGPGAGYFPFYIGLILCISGIGVLYQALAGKVKNTEVFVDRESFKRVLSVLLPAAVYVGFIQVIGIYVASAVYIALFMIILGKYSWLKSVIIALVVNAVFFMMFEVWFKVPLHKGAFDPLSFLGY
ncbi:MAG: tripartite tricarboxylate transporter TctB family protein [Hylemonella sp.]|nr:tripartite tricarboxylate transporter TctB family protein [Hylemonella sp.]